MLLACDFPPVHPMFANHAVARYDDDRSPIDSLTSGQQIDEVRIGRTKYQFRVATRGFFLPAGPTSTGEFYVDGFSPDIVGRGQSPSAARKNWEEEFHQDFQRLYAMRGWEMNSTDKRRWQRINEWIDVDLYRNTTLIVAREIGRITRLSPHKRLIQWIDGRKERFEFGKVPGPFAAYELGTWFEAQVQRDGLSGRLRSILSSQKIDSLDALPANGHTQNHGQVDELAQATL